jgi:NitT/TauT family transport system substrate-binding protein
MKLRSALVFSCAVLVGFLVVMLLHRGGYSGEAAPRKALVAYASFTPSVLWILLEKDLGFFREEGVRPEFIMVRSGGVAVKGLVARNFDYVTAAGPAMDAIIRGRLPLRIVLTAGTINFWLVAQPEIRSVNDLRGKAIAISSLGSATELTTREIFKRHGLDPFRDVTFVAVGASPERLAALNSRAVHATVLSPPVNFKAVEMGYRKLATTTEYMKWPVLGLAVREEQLVQDPSGVARMVQGTLKGIRFVVSQRDYVVSKIMQMFHLNREEAIQTYDAVREESVPSGYLTEEDQRTVISMIKQSGNLTEDIPPERVFDYRFVKQAELELKGWTPQMPR